MVFTLTHPASYFVDMLTLPAFSPAPKEFDAYLPASPELGQHTISDGPYKIDSYTATKNITLSRNPAWDAASDPIRKAYVDKVVDQRDGQPGLHPAAAADRARRAPTWLSTPSRRRRSSRP